MKLLTKAIREKLIANFEANKGKAKTVDHIPVVKLFFPAGRGTWLLSELDPETNIAFGLADLGEPEMGYVDLTELEAVVVRGLKVERDIYWKGAKPLTAYADEARERGMLIA